jgi:hypothetical protein
MTDHDDPDDPMSDHDDPDDPMTERDDPDDPMTEHDDPDDPMTEHDDPDDLLIARLRAYVAEADPVPPLVSQVAKAALGWRRLDADLAELLSDSTLDAAQLALTRGAGASVRSVSFSSGQLTIDIDVQVDGERRTLLGQLSPPSAATIEIQRADDDTTTTAESDSLGRFRTEAVAGRSIRLRVLSADRGAAATVETSWITI